MLTKNGKDIVANFPIFLFTIFKTNYIELNSLA